MSINPQVNQIRNAATLTASANGTSFVKPVSRRAQKVSFLYNLGSNPTGTSPTLKFTLQCSLDGTNWFDVASTASLTASGSGRLEAHAIEAYWRVNETLGGTTPSFTNVTTFLSFDI